LVRYRNDGEGEILFVARKDVTQIKLRGYRIELGDIEVALLSNLPSRGEVGVELVKFKDSPEPVLAAFIHLELFTTWSTTDKDDSLLVTDQVDIFQKVLEEIVKRAARTLPGYMIPSALVPLKRMPVTTNGKKDRRQLRQLAESMTINRSRQKTEAITTKSDSCSTELARKMRAIWASILRIDETSINMRDSFFVLGGDSLVRSLFPALVVGPH
jgi:acyl-coenzyme A synthetase/AMP-(fatty) acid ligase